MFLLRLRDYYLSLLLSCDLYGHHGHFKSPTVAASRSVVAA